MSRLETNSNDIRKRIEGRNLYTHEDPYNVNLSLTVQTINNIADIVLPFSSFDLTNTVVGRMVGANTPIAQIGLKMLSKQFEATIASNASSEYIPNINVSNLFDNDSKTKFITPQKDYQITRRGDRDSIQNILNEISGNYPRNGNPFDKSSTIGDYIKNSGKGQMSLLSDLLNQNKYKPSSKDIVDGFKSKEIEYGLIRIKDKESAQNKSTLLVNDYDQFLNIKDNAKLIGERIKLELYDYRSSLNNNTEGYLEYGNDDFIENLGSTLNNKSKKGNSSLDDFNVTDNLINLVWGRDGVDDKYKRERNSTPNKYKAPDDSGNRVDVNPRFDFTDNGDKFNMNAGGILSQTRELLLAQGEYAMFDLTKKKFKNRNGDIHYNGSPLEETIQGDIDKSRQHSIADPYKGYVKAIRYNGNKIYNGNENSVIYDKVIPQVVPTEKNYKNLMFSIENLAVVVNSNSDETVGIIEDDYSTEIPINEKGIHNGRVMWFPPYDIQLSENVIVHRSTTNFIGRGEPIHTYSNTERFANLSFKLIIDHPPQVRGKNYNDLKASSFFAFGGESNVEKTNIGTKIKIKEELEKERDNIKPEKKVEVPEINSISTSFHFLNDEPKESNINISVEDHIEKKYEISDGNIIENNGELDAKNFQLNNEFKNNIDDIIKYYLNDENKKYVEINLVGSASELFNGTTEAAKEYNKELSKRRIQSIQKYIEKKYSELFDGRILKPEDKKIFITTPIGATGGTATDDVSEINDLESKQARSVSIEFRSNGVTKTRIDEITEKDRENLDILNREISAIETEINKEKRRGVEEQYRNFKALSIENDEIVGFKGIKENAYQPVFFSQTPEDFHRRLTFLHQCTRQGGSIRKDNTESDTADNSVFGRQPVQNLRIGDFFNTKVMIDNMQIDYTDAPWDMNPEGMGMQYMIADVKLTLKILGGQSLKGAVNILQNALSYNYYANSTFYNKGVYNNATRAENLQQQENIDKRNKEKPVKRNTL